MGKKILIVRFSSIGDIILTTPVVRCVKQQVAGAEVHFVTKESFRNVIENNPYIDKLYTFKKDITELYATLKSEKYDVVLDLHKNLRSLRLKRAVGAKSFSFDKINFKKFVAVNLKKLDVLPDKHIVERYFDGVAELGIKDDGAGLDYFIKEEEKIDTGNYFKSAVPVKFIALVVGGSYYTKKIPLNKLVEICQRAQLPVVLLGGPGDKEISDKLQKNFPNTINTCGALSVNQSASVVSQAEWVITSDTGLMHIAAAYKKKIISVWGNTIPEFGMSPYKPMPENKILEINYLRCRPCSKLGYHQCPLGHFRCMKDIDYSFVADLR